MAGTRSDGRDPFPMAARVIVSLVALGVLGYWALWSFALFAIGCSDDYCTGGAFGRDRLRYTLQFLLAAPAVAAGVVGLALGFTSRRQLAARLLGITAVIALLWVVWVLGFGGF